MFKTNEIHWTKIHFIKAERKIFALRTSKNHELDRVFFMSIRINIRLGVASIILRVALVLPT